ncbi:EAL domain-containing protein [Synechococcales cyanobacterium C]|uniref:EAL domain-containing protein n=1 Tax=Petrachloros mirabilis ULC683 TaxID=2781853 RepID=A0A8K2A0R1_9CYAN|nr:EAL domain-containing protein [Petrachloros mirabilis]NCJ07252.1 EAL domain-containing protein [Petrachloros mirabilis ULC683]
MAQVDNQILSDLTVPLVYTPTQDNPASAGLRHNRTPKPHPQAQHMLVIQTQQGEERIYLEATTYSIGRHSANSIVLNAKTVSRQHALLLRISDTATGNYFFRIVDGNFQGKRSHNGLWINGKRCFSHDLKDQDSIQFGAEVQGTYHLSSTPTEPPRATDVTSSSPSAADAAADAGQPRFPSDTELRNLSDAALVRLSSFPELTPHPIIEVDLTGKITYLNPSAMSQFAEIDQDPHHPLLQDLLQLSQHNAQTHFVREVQVDSRIYEQFIHCLPASKLIRSYLIEITQRKRAEAVLRESEDRYAAAARGANDGLWDWNIKTNQIYYSPRWQAMIGHEQAPLNNKVEEWFSRIHPDDRGQVEHALSLHLAGGTPHFESEYRMQHQDGTYRWFRSRGLVVVDHQHEPYRIAGSQTDITEYRLARDQLLHDALHDGMTRLPNRLLLMDRLGQALKKSKRHPDQRCAVLFLDLDRFKLINDSLGHMIGDELLIEVSRRLQQCVRDEDTVARLGGDEFVILLESLANEAEAIETANRILKQIKRGFYLQGHEIFTSTSIGIALSQAHYEEHEDLLRDADTAMYQAKQSGKDRYEVFHPGMHSEALAALKLENDLRHAIERQEFQLYYQPIIALGTQQFIGFEALVRWHQPERGVVPPGEFVHLAEETGLIVPLGWWVLRTACEQLCRWHEQYSLEQPLTISVNISSRQFAQDDFVDRLQVLVESVGLIPGTLKLEITEGVIMEHADSVAEKLMAIKALGISLGIDDFGTGYSSLNYLNQFPVDMLKIDRSFVRKMGQNESLEIVKTIVNLAHNLRMGVVAEGVETEEQMARLLAMNCDYAQGYLFSKPLKSRNAQQLLAYLAQEDRAQPMIWPQALEILAQIKGLQS